MTVGLQLFLDTGFDATTMDDVAAASGVPRRSLFRYFATKEDLVLDWAISGAPELVDHLPVAVEVTRPLPAANEAVLGYVEAHAAMYAQALQVARLMATTPSLRARGHEKYVVWEQLLTDGLSDRGVAPLPARVAAATSITAHRLAVESWADAGDPDTLPDHLRAVFAVAENQTGPAPAAAESTRSTEPPVSQSPAVQPPAPQRGQKEIP